MRLKSKNLKYLTCLKKKHLEINTEKAMLALSVYISISQSL